MVKERVSKVRNVVLLSISLKPRHVPLEYIGVGIGVRMGVGMGARGIDVEVIGENGREDEAGIAGTTGVGAKQEPTLSPWSRWAFRAEALIVMV